MRIREVGANSILCRSAVILGLLRRKENIACSIKNGYPMEKTGLSTKKPHIGSFVSAHSFLGLEI